MLSFSWLPARRGISAAQTGRNMLAAIVPRFALAGMLLVVLVVVMLAGSVASAFGAVRWQLTSLSNTTAASGGTLEYWVQIFNIGDTGTEGGEVTFTVTMPSGLTPTGVSAEIGGFPCSISAQTVTCAGPATFGSHESQSLSIFAAVAPGATGVLTTRYDISGGGAGESADTADPVRISSEDPGFGIDAFDGLSADASGNPYTQAAGHPSLLTTSIDFNTHTDPVIGPRIPVEDVKDVVVDLPAGLVGGVVGVGQCTTPELSNGTGATNPLPLCPETSQVGVMHVRTDRGDSGVVAVYNMVPPPGVPARFAVNVAGDIVVLDASVAGSGGATHVRVRASDIPQGIVIDGNTFNFWGIPSDSSHDSERSCSGQPAPAFPGAPTCKSGGPSKPLFRNPTVCTGSTGLTTTVTADSWAHPGDFKQASFVSHLLPGYPLASVDWGPEQGTDGCDQVPFDPTFEGQPLAGSKAGSPAAFAFDLELPQGDSVTGIGQSDLKKAVVTLPEGVRVSPSSADGLGACSPAQIALQTNTLPSCPDNSKVATVTIDTPLLDIPVTGDVYLATPYENPFDSLVAVYLVASAEGVVIKVPGQVSLNPDTGQITATFDDNPQLPFSKLHLAFNSGPRAPLVAPQHCGTYTTRSQLTGWSGKTVSTDSTFTLSENTGGPGCPSTFSPVLGGGSENPVAARFTPFSLHLARSDTDGEFASLSSVTLPPGLLADVSSVSARCTDAQAAAAACPAASHIGEVTVGAGAGSDPFYVSGDIYLTSSYKGNPFGLATIVHAIAGPFDLGNVVLRAGIQIHNDGSITTLADPFPRILQGIPLQIRDIRVTLDRPNFTLNPTSCAPMSITGTTVSSENQTAGLASRFQVGECSRLAFKPDFKVSTAGKTSRINGASLRVHLGTHEGPNSSVKESNIAKVDVQLPAILPSRLATLQKACTAAQFERDPAGCPEGSFVGTAVAHTPILTSLLAGPAVLVSHGGAAFPDLVLVLQGEGVRIDLTGHTQIKKGITYSHFDTTPDAPVSSFDLTLPQGPHSVLAANNDLCHQQLVMPTTLTAQNGATLNQTTHIKVTGCSKTLAVISRSTSKRTLKLSVYVPAAGQLTATGKDISKATKTANGNEPINLTLHTTKPGQFTTTLKLSFLPNKPPAQSHRSTRQTRQTKTLKVKFAR